MADQSIALMGRQPDINAASPLEAVQRLQSAQQMLQSGGADLDEKLMRQAVAEAGTGGDPQAWSQAMSKAASQGSRTAQQNINYNPLAAQRMMQAYGGNSGPVMSGGQPGQGQPGGGGMGTEGDITQSPGFLQKWGSMKPEERANLLRGFSKAAKVLPTITDQASMDRAVDELKADGLPQAEALRGNFSPVAVQKMYQNIQQMLQFGGQQMSGTLAGAPYVAPYRDEKVGNDITRFNPATGQYEQVYHADYMRPPWRNTGTTTPDGKAIYYNEGTGEEKIGNEKVSAVPGKVRPGKATEIYNLLMDHGGMSEAQAAAIASGQGGLSQQKAREVGASIAAREGLFGAEAESRAQQLSNDFMNLSPAAGGGPKPPPTTVPNPMRPGAPAAAPATTPALPPNLKATYGSPEAALKAHPDTRDAYDQKFGNPADKTPSDKILGPRAPATRTPGPQSMNTTGPANATGEGEGMSVNPPNAADIRSRDEASARARLQAIADRTGRTIDTGSNLGVIRPQTTGQQPQAYAAAQPNSALATSQPIGDMTPEQLARVSRSGRAPNANLTPDVQPIENSRAAISRQNDLTASNTDASGVPLPVQTADTMRGSHAPDQMVQQDAIRTTLAHRLLTARSAAERVEILRQMAENEGVSGFRGAPPAPQPSAVASATP